jgi:cell fate regulator YaaT (PSP1 superfamily)
LATVQRREQEAREGLVLCQAVADRLWLPLKVVDAEAGFEGTHITFYFLADTRVDFRELVKQVARELRVRVHLHQVGSRDHAKQLGGYGPCGRPLCCTTFLRDFAPVSMKMAKDQSLYLNPSKFSGVCGKLMCCLRYEHETYLEAKDRLPPLGASVTTPNGERGVISDVNYLKETVTVVVRDAEGTRFVTHDGADVVVARACGDCGSAGGGCGGGCASGSCGVPAKAAPITQGVITLERRFRTTGNE